MNYRQLGRTGLKISEIGLGCEGFVGQDGAFTREMFSVALNAGVNYMDLYSPNPNLHRHIGQALNGQRAQFIMQAHLCTIWQDQQYKCTRDIGEVRSGFETMLTNLGMDYIDVGMIHYVDSVTTWREIAAGEIMRYARDLQAAGKIRHIGLSSHNPIAALEAVNSGLIDVLMFSVNPCYDLQPGDEDIEKLWADESYAKPLLNMDADRQNLYETCQRLGVGITVMKAFGGGDLLSSDSPAGQALTVNQCIHYALTRPAVATVLCGAHSLAELQANLAYESAPESDRDYAAALASFPKISWQGHCMYCGHCAPCPQGIDVATVTKFLHLAQAQGAVPETVREHYAVLPHTAGACVRCGACEKRCPFKVPVMANMQRSQEIFGK